jgi:diguanylate cyclase (GGDEF)-like protein/PAS domain S-box-containing protein
MRTPDRHTAEDAAAIVRAISRSQAVIEFAPDGTILYANDRFLAIMGYQAAEVVGQHHRLFVEPGEQVSAAYRDFWRRLGDGEFLQAEFKRLAKGGAEVWLHGSYNPVVDDAGRVYKVVKFADDVTAAKLRNADVLGQLAALNKSLAVIEFALDGTILRANENFLALFGYEAGEVEGRHHSMFVEPGHERGADYRALWDKLNRGEFQSAQYKRLAKGGREVWIEATYNPIVDPNGRPYKVVKFARDVTEQVIRKQAELALQQSQTFLQATVDALSVHIAILDETGTIIAVNAVWKRFAERNGYDGAGLGVGADYLRVTESATGECASDARAVGQGIRNVIAGDRAEVLIEYPCHAPAEQRWFAARITRFKWDGPVRVVVAHEDITTRKLAEQSLSLSEQRWKFALEGSQDGMWDWDLVRDRLEHSNRLLEITGLSELCEAPSEQARRVVHPDDIGELSTAMQAALAGRAPLLTIECRVRREGGGWKWILIRGMVVHRAEAGAPLRMVGTVSDISQRKAMEEQLLAAARVDKLTGLPNRAMLLEWLQKTIARYQRFKDRGYAVMFLDFDRFKIVNDTLGHEAGDELLREIARRLAAAVRAVDTVGRDLTETAASRLGGDEFVILLSDIGGTDEAADVADRVLVALSAPYLIAGQEIVSTASIGLVTSTLGYLRAEDVLRDADTAMYEAKAAGKGRVAVFNESMRARLQRKADLEAGLRRALDQGQLVLHYQPITSIATRETEGFEALVRWEHPEHGTIAPGEFIPVAEETGLIIPVGEWVLREVCRQVAAWRERRGPANVPPVSVNLSRAQLLLKNLPDLIGDIVAASGLPPSAIHLEVTESALISNAEQAIRVLHRIKSLGFSVHMDDFGTGYSSLSSLDQFPIDVLKVDRSFVSNLSRGHKFVAMINAIAELARSLNIRVIAEGVETQAQWDLLRSMHCQSAQGYLISTPLPAACVLDYLMGVVVAPFRSSRNCA